MTHLRLLLLASLIGLAGLPSSLPAHPHAWIDLAITLERDRHGHITHMHHGWRFDLTYGQHLYKDAQEHQPGDNPAQQLQGMTREIHAKLSEYHWYSHVEADGESVAVEPAGRA